MSVSVMVAALGWASSIMLVWLWVLGHVEVDVGTCLAFVFFVLLGIGGGSMAMRK